MTRREKLIEKATRSPGSLRFSEAKKLAEIAGFKLDRVGGSHHIYVKDGVDRPIVLQESKDGKAKAYQVKQILDAME